MPKKVGVRYIDTKVLKFTKKQKCARNQVKLIYMKCMCVYTTSTTAVLWF